MTDAALDRAGSRILVVDDHANLVTSLSLTLRTAGYDVVEAVGGELALRRLEEGSFDAVVTDIRMDRVDGHAVLRRALEISKSTRVLLMTGFATVGVAVQALRAGAADFLVKPFGDDELLTRVDHALEYRRLMYRIERLEGDFHDRYRLDRIIGRSAAMRELVGRLMRVAATDATVLITGESGTGKELIARALHTNSRRRGQPFVAVNCAAIPDTLLESELFGHTKGAYTGADRSRRGLYEEAAGGTLFLDEIGETSLAFQAKLLRAVQEGEVRRVGENATTRVDVRLVAATNADLRSAITAKRFREDLYYRLSVVPLRVPPLRERRDDVPLLAQHFLTRFDDRNGSRHRFSQGALDRLAAYDFPGNVRELENLVEQAAALSPDGEIPGDAIRPDPWRANDSGAPPPSHAASVVPLSESLDEAERHAILLALERTDGDLHEVARRLEVSQTTLWRKMKRLRLRP